VSAVEVHAPPAAAFPSPLDDPLSPVEVEEALAAMRASVDAEDARRRAADVRVAHATLAASRPTTVGDDIAARDGSDDAGPGTGALVPLPQPSHAVSLALASALVAAAESASAPGPEPGTQAPTPELVGLRWDYHPQVPPAYAPLGGYALPFSPTADARAAAVHRHPHGGGQLFPHLGDVAGLRAVRARADADRARDTWAASATARRATAGTGAQTLTSTQKVFGRTGTSRTGTGVARRTGAGVGRSGTGRGAAGRGSNQGQDQGDVAGGAGEGESGDEGAGGGGREALLRAHEERKRVDDEAAARRRAREAEIERRRRPEEVTTRFDNWIKPAASG
jgi:hypothetical protein